MKMSNIIKIPKKDRYLTWSGERNHKEKGGWKYKELKWKNVSPPIPPREELLYRIHKSSSANVYFTISRVTEDGETVYHDAKTMRTLKRRKARERTFEGRDGCVSKRIDIRGILLRERSMNTILAYNERDEGSTKRWEEGRYLTW